MNVTHYEYRCDFTMHTKLSGKVFFTFSDKTNPEKQPAKQHAYIREILQPYAAQGSWEMLNEKEVMIITKGEVEMRYYIQKQTNVTPVRNGVELPDHTELWVDVPSSSRSEGTQDNTRENRASKRGRTQRGARQAPNPEVQAAPRSVYYGAHVQQHANPIYPNLDNME